MPVRDIDDIERLKKINAALISRVERSMDQQGNAFTLFQTAINLESRVKARTEELRSTLRRLEQSNIDLVAAKENAELANLSKTRFLAAASHDVLQPLNAAHLSISALAEMQTSEEGRKLVRQVERSLETMDDLLRTLLDISKLDAGVVRARHRRRRRWSRLFAVAADRTSSRSPHKKGLKLQVPRRQRRRSAPTARCCAASCRTSSPTRCATPQPAACWSARGSAAAWSASRSPIPAAAFRRTSTRRSSRSSIAAPMTLRRRDLGRRPRPRPVDRAPHGRRARPHDLVLLGGRPRHGIPARAAGGAAGSRPRPARAGRAGAAARLRPVRHQGAADRERSRRARGDARAAGALAMRWCAPPPRSTRRSTQLGDTDWVPDIIIADQHLERGDLGSDTVGAGARLSAAQRAGADHHRRLLGRHAAHRPRARASN